MQKVSLIIFSALFLSSLSVQASSHGNKAKMKMKMEKQQKSLAMKHANPLPNLMKVTRKYGNELNLSVEQTTELKKWSRHNGPIMQDMVKELLNAERALHSAALGNASQAELQDMMDNVLRIRLKIAQGKMRCRENMKNILNEQQWNKVVSIYQQRIM